MTQQDKDDATLDALLAALRDEERAQAAPLPLKATVMRELQAPQAGEESAGGLLEELGRWLRQHRLQASLLGATATAAPLALGVLLGTLAGPVVESPTTGAIDEAQALELAIDPTAAWLNDLQSYGVLDEEGALSP